MTSTLVALEGASGAGKTTLCTELLKRNPSWIGVPQLTFPRERDRVTEVVGNSASDYIALGTAMSYANAIVISDRGFLGGWVYEAYKYGLREKWRSDFYQSIENLEDIFHYELAARWPDMKHIIERPNIHIIVLDPTHEQLDKQRYSANKEYPYDELGLYRNMALQLYGYTNGLHIRISLIPYPLSVETIEGIIKIKEDK